MEAFDKAIRLWMIGRRHLVLYAQHLTHVCPDF
jgi:hypothetical protein